MSNARRRNRVDDRRHRTSRLKMKPTRWNHSLSLTENIHGLIESVVCTRNTYTSSMIVNHRPSLFLRLWMLVNARVEASCYQENLYYSLRQDSRNVRHAWSKPFLATVARGSPSYLVTLRVHLDTSCSRKAWRQTRRYETHLKLHRSLIQAISSLLCRKTLALLTRCFRAAAYIRLSKNDFTMNLHRWVIPMEQWQTESSTIWHRMHTSDVLPKMFQLYCHVNRFPKNLCGLDRNCNPRKMKDVNLIVVTL